VTPVTSQEINPHDIDRHDIDRVDTLRMWDVTFGLGDQLAAAAAMVAGGIRGLPERSAIDHLVMLGMGGSGIAGDVLAAVAGPSSPVPISVVKDSVLPGYVGRRSLVIALSFSGQTSETVAGATAALERGASVVSVSAGGALAALVEDAGGVALGLDGAIPMPRAALGALVAPVVAVTEDVGLLPGARAQVAAAVDQVRRRAELLARPGSAAAVLARTIGRTWPVIYGAGALGGAAAVRWKNQVNENAKAPAFCHTLPEVCHNELCGWGQHGDVTRQVLTLVELRHGFETPDVGRRFSLMDDQMLEVVADICTVEADGDGPLAQLFDLVLVGDVTSLHLAADAGVDPGPIPALDAMKAGLQAPSG
jgi:glucose/mannose-6-phosphate isomerase